jgi:hypothetical protein
LCVVLFFLNMVLLLAHLTVIFCLFHPIYKVILGVHPARSTTPAGSNKKTEKGPERSEHRSRRLY